MGQQETKRIGHQQIGMGVVGHERKTATAPAPLAPRKPLTPAEIVAGSDIGQMQDLAGQIGQLAQASQKTEPPATPTPAQ